VCLAGLAEIAGEAVLLAGVALAQHLRERLLTFPNSLGSQSLHQCLTRAVMAPLDERDAGHPAAAVPKVEPWSFPETDDSLRSALLLDLMALLDITGLTSHRTSGLRLCPTLDFP
jgi:hypothetical protein